jgi:hypothetical protein
LPVSIESTPVLEAEPKLISLKDVGLIYIVRAFVAVLDRSTVTYIYPVAFTAIVDESDEKVKVFPDAKPDEIIPIWSAVDNEEESLYHNLKFTISEVV